MANEDEKVVRRNALLALIEDGGGELQERTARMDRADIFGAPISAGEMYYALRRGARFDGVLAVSENSMAALSELLMESTLLREVGSRLIEARFARLRAAVDRLGSL